MAQITPVHVTTLADTTNVAASGTYTFGGGALNPPDNDGLLIWVQLRGHELPPASVTGLGVTWVKVADDGGIGNSRSLSLWRALGDVTAGSIVVTNAAAAATGCDISFVRVPGVDTSGTNGSGMIGDVTVSLDSSAATSEALTNATFLSEDNVTIGGFEKNVNEALAAITGGGDTLLGTAGSNNPASCIGTVYDAADETVGMQSATSQNIMGIAVEIKAAAGGAPNAGAATGAISFAGVATGVRVPKGAATGTNAWAGSATGKRVPKGASTGAVVWAGSATGEAPSVGANDGSASGTWSLSGVATGTRASRGSATGTVTWAGSAIGTSVHRGFCTGTWTLAGTATGATVKRGSVTGTWTLAGSATGEAPGVGVQEGSASGTWTLAGSATGARASKGSATGAISWAGSATGIREYSGSATGAYSFSGVATGARVSKGSASGTISWVGEIPLPILWLPTPRRETTLTGRRGTVATAGRTLALTSRQLASATPGRSTTATERRD